MKNLILVLVASSFTVLSACNSKPMVECSKCNRSFESGSGYSVMPFYGVQKTDPRAVEKGPSMFEHYCSQECALQSQ